MVGGPTWYCWVGDVDILHTAIHDKLPKVYCHRLPVAAEQRAGGGEEEAHFTFFF